jgi:hypothetical protein
MNALNFWKGSAFSFGKAEFRSLFSLRLGVRLIGAALVCIAILYGVDALLFDGCYVQGVDRAMTAIYRHW